MGRSSSRPSRTSGEVGRIVGTSDGVFHSSVHPCLPAHLITVFPYAQTGCCLFCTAWVWEERSWGPQLGQPSSLIQGHGVWVHDGCGIQTGLWTLGLESPYYPRPSEHLICSCLFHTMILAAHFLLQLFDVCPCIRVPWHICGTQFSSINWVSRVKLGSSGLVVKIFTY